MIAVAAATAVTAALGLAAPAGAATTTTISSVGFEDGSTGPWGPRGGVTLTVTGAEAHVGTKALAVTGRTANWQGLSANSAGLLTEGSVYQISAWVKLPAGATETTGINFTAEQTPVSGSNTYTRIGNAVDTTAAGWVQIGGTYTMPSAMSSVNIYIEAAAVGDLQPSFLVDDIVITTESDVTPPGVEDLTGLKETADFPVGVAIDSRETTGTASDLLLRHFDQVTPENFMKPEAWYDANGDFVTENAEADALMDFAQQHDLRVYGHVLAWHGQTPAWFFQDDAGQPLAADDAGRAVLRDRLRTHIFDVAQYLSDRYGLFGSSTNPLRAFDVVNEVVSDGGEYADGLRRSEWYRVLGEDFIDLAFTYAEEAFNQTFAAPTADRPIALFINDYNTEQGGKQQRYHALVSRLIARGVPVDGVGHQFHVSLAMPVSALDAALTAFDDLPVKQAVTEFDVSAGTPLTQAKLVDQGYYYRDAFRVFRAHADDLFSVTVWGLTDGRSWRNDEGAPLLFNDSFHAKPAYFGAVDAELPVPQRAANVFGGDVPLDAAATSSPEWQRLPLHDLQGTASFQLRWAADHLTVYASVDDAAADAADGVELALGDAVYRVARDGTGDAPAVVTERDGGYDVVAQLPLTAAAAGDTLAFDLRVATGTSTVAWNGPGTLGTLTLVKPVSFVEVVQADAAPVVDGVVDAAWADARVVTTGKAVSGTGGAIATVRTLWSGSTLYVLARVADPTVDVSGSDPWIQDSVEVYVDPGNAKNGSYRPVDSQIRVSAANAVSFGTGDEAFQRGRVTSATALADGGYVVELAVDLGEAAGLGTFHGLDFQVNDASGGQRTAISNWADPTGAGYQSTARWGVGRFVGPAAPVSVVAPAVTGHAAVNGKLTATPGDWRGAGLTFTYQWQRDGIDIPDARRAVYPVRGSDRGHDVSVVVTATAADGQATSAASTAVPIPPKK